MSMRQNFSPKVSLTDFFPHFSVQNYNTSPLNQSPASRMELPWFSWTNEDSPLGQGRGSTPPPQSTWSLNTKLKSISKEGRWNMGHGYRPILYAFIFSVQAAVQLPIDWPACLLVCQSLLETVGPPDYSHQSVCLPVHLFICVSICLSVCL